MTGCPTCRRPASTAVKSYPFCSPRCQMVDLGKWLNEEHRIPDESEVPQTPPGSDEA